MLQLESVNSFYDSSHILHDINLTIGKGKIFSILGRNGVGKSTLLKTIMGLTSSMTGKLRLNEEDLSSKTTFSRARAGIGYVPQGREIIPDFSVKENILMGRFADLNGKVEIPELVPELFPYLMDNLGRAGDCSRADSNNNWPLPGLWQPIRIFYYWMNPRKAFSPTSLNKLKNAS